MFRKIKKYFEKESLDKEMYMLNNCIRIAEAYGDLDERNKYVEELGNVIVKRYSL